MLDIYRLRTDTEFCGWAKSQMTCRTAGSKSPPANVGEQDTLDTILLSKTSFQTPSSFADILLS